MSYGYARANKAYSTIGSHSGIEGATPHRLIQLLLESALDRLAKTKGYMMRTEVAAKCSSINRVVEILAHLRGCLDSELDSPIRVNLESLYVYMSKRLYVANRDNDLVALDEVSQLFREIKSGWDAIPMSFRAGYFAAPGAAANSASPAAW